LGERKMRSHIFRILLVLALTLSALSVSYAQKDPELFKQDTPCEKKIDPALREAIFLSPITRRKSEEKKKSLFGFFKSKAFAASKDQTDERKKIREDWKKLLGIDIFYPYFKAKEIEHVVQEKTSLKILDLKGRPEFSENYKEIDYIFKKKF
jgi:hypothetical protein